MTDIIEQLRGMRSCTVCEGDGIKSTGKVCGGCNGTGEVPRYDSVGLQAADRIAALERERDEATSLLAEYRDHSQPYWQARAEAAERERDELKAALDKARRDSLLEAARYLDDRGVTMDSSILAAGLRALSSGRVE